MITPLQALLSIQAILSGNEWSADTAPAIAEVMESAGYFIADSGELDEVQA